MDQERECILLDKKIRIEEFQKEVQAEMNQYSDCMSVGELEACEEIYVIIGELYLNVSALYEKEKKDRRTCDVEVVKKAVTNGEFKRKNERETHI